MKRAIVYTAGLALAGAAFAQSYYDEQAGVGSQGGYPPCSATVTDRCIQLYERDVATPANLALNERLGQGNNQLASIPEAETVDIDYAEAEMAEPEPYYSGYDNDTAVGGPYEPAWTTVHAQGNWPARTEGDYPPCAPHPADDRCIQLYEGGVGTHWGWY